MIWGAQYLKAESAAFSSNHPGSMDVTPFRPFLVLYSFCLAALMLWGSSVMVSSHNTRAIIVVAKRASPDLAGFLAQITGVARPASRSRVLINRSYPEHAFLVLTNAQHLHTVFPNLELSLFWGSNRQISRRLNVLQYDSHLPDPNGGRTYVFKIYQNRASLSIRQNGEEIHFMPDAYTWHESIYLEEHKTVVLLERRSNGIPTFSAQIYEQDRKTPFSRWFNLTSEYVNIATGPHRDIPSRKFVVSQKASDLQSHPHLQLCLEWEKKENLKPIFMDAFHKYHNQDIEAKMFIYGVFEDHISLTIVNLTNEVGEKSKRDEHWEEFQKLQDIPTPDTKNIIVVVQLLQTSNLPIVFANLMKEDKSKLSHAVMLSQQEREKRFFVPNIENTFQLNLYWDSASIDINSRDYDGHNAQGKLHIFKILALHVQVQVWSKLSDKGMRTLMHSQKVADLPRHD